MKSRLKVLVSITAFLITVLVAGSMLTTEVSAAPKLNKKAKTIQQGKSYSLKISGVKSGNIKKVTFKQSKKILKLKKKTKKTITVKGLKKGKTTLKVTIRYKKKIKGKKTVTLKCKINVKKKSNPQNTNSNSGANSSQTNNSGNTDFDTVPFMNLTSLEKTIEGLSSSGYYNYKKINNYLYKETTENQYLFVEGPNWHATEFYNEYEYKTIMSKIDEIVKGSKITGDMTDQEKVYRVGRYMIDNIDYVFTTHEQTIYGTLVNKQTVCAGYSRTFAVVCRYLGIDCDYVCSHYGDSGHAWNYVKLGDYYYVADLTNAYFARNVNYGVWDLFCGIEALGSEEDIKEIDECYKTEEYIKTHPVDTVDYYTRCKNDGKSYYSGRELIDRYDEATMK